jgi:hypothetical protein
LQVGTPSASLTEAVAVDTSVLFPEAAAAYPVCCCGSRERLLLETLFVFVECLFFIFVELFLPFVTEGLCPNVCFPYSKRSQI